ncbi:MAG TPA: phosphoribosylanthranilate isomerase [Firmicutes bacterium]|uniref:N-(5'-phosphoribosyl)anthranilate isomerase n=1 Tax=Capillibacterium thermochitinicola TaxID=2699427 RepID=A0A8J6HZ95_9FIRM|nr:phosphoribosylanthranilate isomerase [Capillibacterium thermochitinicola]MBA2132536.1 phosphoribosylanthranilate isomerase [Capillibacterium thermochitinicola]HHW11536.1 phosphoribosylanthranilate isomerase [Bacillota bacterium]
MIPVKICGITNLNDALVCQKLGVSALGFVFAPSPRRVSVEQVAQITRHLSPLILKVGVFVDEDPLRIHEVMEACRLDLAQLHGAEKPEHCQILGGRVIKAFRAGRDQPDPEWRGAPLRGILVDSYAANVYGGTGQVFDWALVANYRKLGFPLILAGGLNPENIGAALRRVQPDGIDLSSGVEKSPGIKDPDKIARLMATIRNSSSP